jgi:serine/threonine-protein kinase
LAVARAADPDPWRNRLRDLFEQGPESRERLLELAAAAPVDDLPPSTLFLLAQAVSLVKISDDRVTAVLRQAQRKYAGDFWINFMLAKYFETMQPPRQDEVVRYYSVALGLRPGVAAVHNNLGVALSRLGRPDDALAEFRAAFKLQPEFAAAHSNLGHTLRELERYDEAVTALRKAAQLQPSHPMIRRNLGLALMGQGKLDEATAEIQEAIRLAPKTKEFHDDLVQALKMQGRLEEAALYRQKQELESDAKSATELATSPR